MSGKTFDVFGLGQCSLDCIGRIEAYPPPDVKCEFSDMVIQGGGPVATALVALARWGLSCSFAGTIGDDLFGKMIEDSLRDESINTGGIVKRSGFSSQFAFIAAEAGHGRRTIFWQRPTGPPIGPGEVDIDRLQKSRVFHTDGLFAGASIFVAEEAKKRGIPVVVDAGTLREGMLKLAGLSDYFIASRTFARQFSESDDPDDTLRKLSKLGPRLVGITLGHEGYAAIFDGKIVRKPAYPVDAIDTTGCGDVFHAGFVYGLVRKWDLEKCLDFAAWAAAMVSLRMGGRTGIPTTAEMREKGF
ncbi:MAG: PfkB family carbohydrate kinase [Thermodesulfobacteriota bacterium]|nr:PfkB family carbohydrate kinase [Thermodesulfobacteriota bacterium]